MNRPVNLSILKREKCLIGWGLPPLVLTLFLVAGLAEASDNINTYQNIEARLSSNSPTPTSSAPAHLDGDSSLVPVDRLVAKPPLVAHGSRQGNGQNGANGGDASGSKPSGIPIRLPLLPSRFIVCEPLGPEVRPKEVDPNEVKPEPAVKKKETPEVVQKPSPTPSPVDQEALAAFAAYKKRQLDAIESDRETLTALQSAIANLGLQEKLKFINDQIVPSQVKLEKKPEPSPSQPVGQSSLVPSLVPSPISSVMPSVLAPSPLPSPPTPAPLSLPEAKATIDAQSKEQAQVATPTVLPKSTASPKPEEPLKKKVLKPRKSQQEKTKAGNIQK